MEDLKSYDIEKDVHNMADWLTNELKEDWEYDRERVARNILSNCEAVKQLLTLQDRYNAQEKAKAGAYWERNQLVSALSKLFPAWMEKHPDSDTSWDEEWRYIIFIELPTGQASWHIHDSEFKSFQHLTYKNVCSWDGHTTEEKYKRLSQLKAKEA